MEKFILLVILAIVLAVSNAQYTWDKIVFDTESENGLDNQTASSGDKLKSGDSSADDLSDRFMVGDDYNDDDDDDGNTALIPSLQSIFQPHLGLLELAETFMRLVGEIGRKIRDAFFANRFLLRDSVGFLVRKTARLHTFLTNGLSILRRVLQIALELFSNWNLQLPPISEALKRPEASYDSRPLSVPLSYPRPYGNNWA